MKLVIDYLRAEAARLRILISADDIALLSNGISDNAHDGIQSRQRDRQDALVDIEEAADVLDCGY